MPRVRALSVVVASVVLLSIVPLLVPGEASASPVIMEAYRASVIPPAGANACGEHVTPWQDTPRYQEPITGATVAFKHDGENLYFYAEWRVARPSYRDYFGVEFDNNGDTAHMGTSASPDDAFFLSPSFGATSTCARDALLTGFARQTFDVDAGGANDATGRMTYVNGTYFIEVRRPFVTNDATGHDITLAEDSSIGVGFAAGVFGAGAGHLATDMATYMLVLTNKTEAVVPEVPITNPVDIAYWAGTLGLAATFALVGFHFVRRRAWRRSPAFGRAVKAPIPFVRVRRHAVSIRAIHWAHAGLMVALIATGIGIHWRVYLFGSLNTLVHVGVGLTILLVDFPIRFFVLRKAKEFGVLAKPLKDDFREIGAITANFFGVRKDYPEHSTFDTSTRRYYLDRKYCAFQKAMLWGDMLGIVAIAITGMALYTNAFAWVVDLLGGALNVRAIHALLFFYFAATLIGHVYLSAIPFNWGKMSSMVTGVGLIRKHVTEDEESPVRPSVPQADGSAVRR